MLLGRVAIDRFANRTGVQLSLRPHELAGIDAAVMAGLREWKLVQEAEAAAAAAMAVAAAARGKRLRKNKLSL